MAKKVESKTSKKEKTPDLKVVLYDVIGETLAEKFDEYDVLRIKPTGTSEGILVTVGDKDYYLVMTAKKTQIEYDKEEIKRNYTAELLDDDDDEEEESKEEKE